MYITINNVIGEKTIYLSYPVKNFDSNKEVAVTVMFSDNIQNEMEDPFKLKLIDNGEKQDLYKQRIKCACGKKNDTYKFGNN